MGIQEQIIDAIQKQAGKVIQTLLKDLKIKSFHGIRINVGKTVIHPPKVRIKSKGFKVKLIDKSTGEAISDIPIPLDIKINISPIEINIDPIDIDPSIDVPLGNQKK